MRLRLSLLLLVMSFLLFEAGSAFSQTTPVAIGATAKPLSEKPDTSVLKRRSVPDTIMFTIDEYNDIKDRKAGAGATSDDAQKSGPGANTIFLGSILYYGPKDWTIWVNGQPIGPDEDFQTFQVTEITPRYVELLVPLSVQGMRPVHLEPNQTFISESGIVVEGRYP